MGLYSDVTKASWRLRWLATWLFVQHLIQTDNKENSKAFHYWHFLRGIQGWSLDFPHKGTVIVCIPLGLKISKKLSLVTLLKFYICNNLIRISEKILQKPNCPIDSFTFPKPFGHGIYEALPCWEDVQKLFYFQSCWPYFGLLVAQN